MKSYRKLFRLTLGVDGLLVSKLLKHLGGSGQSIARLAYGAVDDELVNSQLPEGVLVLFFLRLRHICR